MKKLILLSLLIISGLINGLMLSGASGITSKSNPRLTVMTYNIGVESPPVPSVKSIAAVIRKNGVPDVLLIQDKPWTVKLGPLADALGYKYRLLGREQKPATNSGILSKHPLNKPILINFYPQNPRPSALGATISFRGRRILVVSVHLISLRQLGTPKYGKCSARGSIRLIWDEYTSGSCHEKSVRRLIRWLGTQRYDYALVGGDFNAPLMSKPIRLMAAKFNDALWPGPDYSFGTKILSSRFLPNLRIDYLFHSTNLVRLESKVVKTTAGDHYPIRAAFGLSRQRQSPPALLLIAFSFFALGLTAVGFEDLNRHSFSGLKVRAMKRQLPEGTPTGQKAGQLRGMIEKFGTIPWMIAGVSQLAGSVLVGIYLIRLSSG